MNKELAFSCYRTFFSETYANPLKNLKSNTSQNLLAILEAAVNMKVANSVGTIILFRP
jgi:hypothetical protein